MGTPRSIGNSIVNLGIIFLIKAIQLKQPKLLFWVGVFMGLMFISHPYSSVVIITILLILFRLPFPRLLSYRYFITGGSLILGVLIIKLIIFDFEHIQHYFNFVSSRLTFSSSTSNLFSRFSYFWESYTLGIKRLYILFFEIGILIIGFFKYRKDPLIANLSTIGLLSFIIGLLLLSPFRRRYMGIIMIFSIITSIAIISSDKSQFKKITTIALIAYFANNMLGNGYYIYKQFNNTSYSKITRQLQTEIPEGSHIMAPIQFWIALHSFYTMTDIHDQLKSDTVLNHLNKMDYIIRSPFFLKNISPTTGGDAIGYNLSENSFHNTLMTVTQTNEWIKQKEIIGNPYNKISIYRRVKE